MIFLPIRSQLNHSWNNIRPYVAWFSNRHTSCIVIWTCQNASQFVVTSRDSSNVLDQPNLTLKCFVSKCIVYYINMHRLDDTGRSELLCHRLCQPFESSYTHIYIRVCHHFRQDLLLTIFLPWFVDKAVHRCRSIVRTHSINTCYMVHLSCLSKYSKPWRLDESLICRIPFQQLIWFQHVERVLYSFQDHIDCILIKRSFSWQSKITFS